MSGGAVAEVSFDPVLRDCHLSLLQRQLASADTPVEICFQRILDVGVPFQVVRLGPEIFDLIGTTELQRYQMVSLTTDTGLQYPAILVIDTGFHSTRHRPYALGIAYCT
jgi:hypothetical protein